MNYSTLSNLAGVLAPNKYVGNGNLVLTFVVIASTAIQALQSYFSSKSNELNLSVIRQKLVELITMGSHVTEHPAIMSEMVDIANQVNPTVGAPDLSLSAATFETSPERTSEIHYSDLLVDDSNLEVDQDMKSTGFSSSIARFLSENSSKLGIGTLLAMAAYLAYRLYTKYGNKQKTSQLIELMPDSTSKSMVSTLFSLVPNESDVIPDNIGIEGNKLAIYELTASKGIQEQAKSVRDRMEILKLRVEAGKVNDPKAYLACLMFDKTVDVAQAYDDIYLVDNLRGV